MLKRIFKILLILSAFLLIVFFCYFNNLSLVNTKTANIYSQLKDSLRSRGYRPRLLVISGKRFKFHNSLLVKTSGAATRSKHLSGDAIDFLVLDVNYDRKTDSSDVNIVLQVLEKNLMQWSGGIGTYKNESAFFDRQMIHIDCRNAKDRWNR